MSRHYPHRFGQFIIIFTLVMGVASLILIRPANSSEIEGVDGPTVKAVTATPTSPPQVVPPPVATNTPLPSPISSPTPPKTAITVKATFSPPPSPTAVVLPTKSLIPFAYDKFNSLPPAVMPIESNPASNLSSSPPSPMEMNPAFSRVSQSPTLPPSTAALVSAHPRFLLVDQEAQIMFVYENGLEVRQIPVSTGAPVINRFTPSWQGAVGESWGAGTIGSEGFYVDYMWYLFDGAEGSILIHSVPYLKDDDTKVYDQIEALGVYPTSHGCVRISPRDAVWLKAWDPVDVAIKITRYTGPLSSVDNLLLPEAWKD